MTKNYHKYTEYMRYVDFKRLDFIIQSIKEHKKNQHNHKIRILDVGCGVGNISFPLASLGYNIVGIDMNPKSIDYAKSKNIFKNARFEVGDAENLSLEGIFDVIICSEVFDYLKKPSQLANSLNKLLKSDGILLIAIPNGYGPYILLEVFPLKFFKKINRTNSAFVRPKVQFFTIKKFSNLLNESGFSILEIKHSDFLSFFVKSKKLCYYDCKLADRLPHFLVSGWYFICMHKNYIKQEAIKTYGKRR